MQKSFCIYYHRNRSCKDVKWRFYHSERLFIVFDGKILGEFKWITIEKLFFECFDGKKMPNRLWKSVLSAYGVSLNGCVEHFLPSEQCFGVNAMVKKNVYKKILPLEKVFLRFEW